MLEINRPDRCGDGCAARATLRTPEARHGQYWLSKLMPSRKRNQVWSKRFRRPGIVLACRDCARSLGWFVAMATRRTGRHFLLQARSSLRSKQHFESIVHDIDRQQITA